MSVSALVEKAVYVSLEGGLGNQMFQYAAARGLAERLGVPVRLDTRWFALSPNRPFMLDRLRVDAPIATPAELDYFATPAADWIKRRLRRLLTPAQRAHPWLNHPDVYREPALYVHDPALARRTAPVLIQGYLQTEAYFTQCVDAVRGAFQLRDALSDESQRAGQRIAAAAWPVSLHVRRGDFAANAHFAAFHGVLPMRYYQRATGIVDRLSGGQAHYFIFSDDPDWVAREFVWLPARTVLGGNGARPWEDLALMALARDHIVANSSFSWWGAWLNARADKTVIAPRFWISRAELAKTATVDTIPDGWITLW